MKKLATGQLFVGQKLRIWGAGLSGWAGPVSPLECQASSTVGLLMHMNGTYRAHWADRLGLCKGGGAPLAFRCIKGMGGPVPSTLIGVTRIYPVLYRERLSNGGFIVRSERMEAKMIQLYKQREYLQRMPLVLNIFGLTPYLAILEVCLNMNHYTSSRQRKKKAAAATKRRDGKETEIAAPTTTCSSDCLLLQA